jgi:hypothetical protein
MGEDEHGEIHHLNMTRFQSSLHNTIRSAGIQTT